MSLVEIALLSGEDLKQKTKLCLRAAGIWEGAHFKDLKELVSQMPNLMEMDLGYNQVGGHSFFDWLVEWVKENPARKVDVGGIFYEDKVLKEVKELNLDNQFITK
jgi:hypothetical protein